jgi:hypothetical protein
MYKIQVKGKVYHCVPFSNINYLDIYCEHKLIKTIRHYNLDNRIYAKQCLLEYLRNNNL